VQPRTAQEALAALSAGEADAALVDAITAYDFLKTEAGFALAGPLLEPEPYVIAVSAQSTDLHRVLDDTLAAMEADGTLGELRVKWFGEAAR
jgi:ABC-type amino acid transport substrate-binding protein